MERDENKFTGLKIIAHILITLPLANTILSLVNKRNFLDSIALYLIEED